MKGSIGHSGRQWRFTARRRGWIALLAAVVGLTVLMPGWASAATQGPLTPSAATNDTSIGTVAWSSPADGLTSNNVYAFAGVVANATTRYLKLTNFGAAIPAGSTITGISVSVERIKTGASQDVRDASVKLVKGSAVTGSEHANTTAVWPYAADGTATYGSSSDLWGTTVTAADVNSSGFGVAISARNYGSASSFAKIDSATITISYTSGGTSPSSATPPGIAGTPTVGSTLTRVQGTWNGSTPITYTYQWRRCDSAGANCVDISGATSTSYVLASGDLGKTIRVQETATNSSGFAAASSAQTSVVTAGGGATSWTATNYSSTTFSNPSNIPYTSWTGMWRNPADSSLWMAFNESSGTQSTFTPSWAATRLGGQPAQARDHWGLTNRTAYYKSTNHGGSWSAAFPNNGVPDESRTWNPAVSSCASSASTGSNCPTVHPIPFTPQANIALNDGTIIRRVNGEDIKYDQVVKKTAFIQRLAPGAGQTWSAPEYLLDPTTCTCTYQISRIKKLADGRLVAVGQKWDTYDPKSGVAHLLVMVSDSSGNNWTEALNSTNLDSFLPNETDVAELPNGDLMAIFRTFTKCPSTTNGCYNRYQALLRKSGSAWTAAVADVKQTPFSHSGHPELVATSSGALLYIATVDTPRAGETAKQGIWFLSNANAQANSANWTLLPFANTSAQPNCVAAGGDWNCSSRYYPRAVEDCYLGTCTIIIASHTGSDNDYWEVNGHAGVPQVDQSIILQKFVLTSP